MKLSRGMIVLVAAVVLSIGYLTADIFSEKKEKAQQDLRAQILTLPLGQIEAFSIEKLDGEVLSLQKKNQEWWITRPFEELADQKSVQDYLEAATLERSTSVVAEGASLDLSIYKLTPPLATLIFEGPNENRFRIRVGQMKSFEGNSYLQVQEDQRVLLASSVWASRATKPVFDFRDQRILKTDTSVVDEWILQLQGSKYHFKKQDGQWRELGHPQWKLDQDRIAELLNHLRNIRAIDIRKMAPGEKSGAAEMRVTLISQSKPQWQSSWVTNPSGEVWVSLIHPQDDKKFKLGLSDSERFSKMTESSLRDRSQPFDLEVEKLSHAQWTKDGQTKSTEVPETVKKLVEKIKALEVYEFTTKKDKTLQAATRLQLGDSQSPSIWTMEYSGPEKIQNQGQEKSVYLAKVSTLSEVVYIDAAAIDNLKMEEIFK